MYKQSPEIRFLVHSYLYYILDDPIVPDYLYDKWCNELLDNYDKLVVDYKHLITKDRLKAGSGFDIYVKDYPDFIKQLADRLRRTHYERLSNFSS